MSDSVARFSFCQNISEGGEEAKDAVKKRKYTVTLIVRLINCEST